jgi:hypothetical protein
MLPLSIALSVLFLCVSGLVALKWTLVHREKKFEHLPLVEMMAKIDELESKLLGNAMRRG